MRKLLVEEMKRAIAIMEERPELERQSSCEKYGYEYMKTNKDIVELRDLFKSIRRHTVLIEKGMK